MLSNTQLMNKYAAEYAALRKILEFIMDGNQDAFAILLYIRGNFKQSNEMILWIKNNKLCGQKLVDFMKNESDESGGGYLLGCQKILSMMDGKKHSVRSVKIDELK